jgi:hypothetical protein
MGGLSRVKLYRLYFTTNLSFKNMKKLISIIKFITDYSMLHCIIIATQHGNILQQRKVFQGTK